jgi:hypothetical protein
MYYLRGYETILFTNGIYQHFRSDLAKSDCYGIMKRHYVSKVPTYDGNYVTQYGGTRAIKHPIQDLWCVEFQSIDGINPIYANYLETKEQLELDGWVIDDVNVEVVEFEEIVKSPSIESRIEAIEGILMMILE